LSSRLAYKEINKSDNQIIFDAWGSNADNFYYLSAKVQESLSDSNVYIESLLEAPENLSFHIVLEQTGEVLGLIKALVTGSAAKVGYVVDKKHSSKGYATEALKWIVSKLELDGSIDRIWASCSVENIATIKVLEKAGFQREKLMKNWLVYPAQGSEAKDNYFYVYN